ncbi:hypothetical protein HRR83_008435 [Exophiala dermatitidis]|uniref:Uncharacterized protein n=1 Tax=Exophiala dermatitidis TaxID=5970 RepID=A0AAN6IU36_EXODE|nr:hypothetical protein HRR73_008250 [Exophiala dermatitidis]KAJ4506494.1 hypothetical protein HRR74_008392 [Exophiala dermatitidis]KAJ4533678.1 hypothetical protein HRR77_008432 [Exophiala dermatitidis]KAJ4547391.1 hypothetical protein HRR76_000039 [Exophiala dermatitidis]KAJ4563836.1 hypothetical protein HRR81_008379 [Exophiala dermatitidis]
MIGKQITGDERHELEDNQINTPMQLGSLSQGGDTKYPLQAISSAIGRPALRLRQLERVDHFTWLSHANTFRARGEHLLQQLQSLHVDYYSYKNLTLLDKR